MFGVGLGVRLVVADAPAPPVPAPPGKPPFPLPSPSLRRRSSSWWFSNGNDHGRYSATIATSSRAARRRWWSDPDSNQQDYGSSSREEEYDYDYDYEDGAAFPGFGGAGELFDEPWFSKVFKTYGFLLPVMLASMLAATGPKAFLMAMAIPLGQSAISFLLDAVWGRRKSNRYDRWRRPFQEEEEEEDYPEDTTDFSTGDRGNGYSGGRDYYEGRRRSDQSWVPNDFADAVSGGADDNNTNSSSSGDDGGNKSGGEYGGWDEILDNNTAAAQKTERSNSSFSAGSADYSMKSRPSGSGQEDAGYTAATNGGRVEQGVGAPPARMRMRRRRMPRTMGLGSTRYKQAPLLMRLLVAVFPFLGSWFRLL